MNRGTFFLYICFLLVGTFCLKIQGSDQSSAPEGSEQSSFNAQQPRQKSLLEHFRGVLRSAFQTGVTFPQDLRELRDQNQFLTSRVEDLLQEVEELTRARDNAIAESKKEWEGHNVIYDQLRGEIIELTDQLAQRKLDLEHSQGELRGVQERYDLLNGQFQNVREENVRLGQQLQQEQEEKKVMQQEVRRRTLELQKAREASDKEFARLVDVEGRETNSNEGDRQIAILVGDNVRQEDRIRVLEGKKNFLKSNNEALGRENRVLSRDNEGLQRENDRFKMFGGFAAGVVVGKLGCSYLISREKKS